MKCYMCGKEFKKGDTIAIINDKPVHGSECDNNNDCEIDCLYESVNIHYLEYGNKDYKEFEEEYEH